MTIGDGTQVGPGVQLLAADHPRDAQTRRDLLELARPISIGSNVWLGAAAIVLPGVSVGADSIIGAGSVVTRDIPSACWRWGILVASCGSCEAAVARRAL